MALPSSAKTLEVSHVAPLTTSPESNVHFTLPLTFFDIIWFKFAPVERVFFYALPETKHTFFNSVLPKLKHTLSLTLQYFLPLAGKITWPQDSPKLVLQYTPGDVVSVSVAESDADFDLIASNRAFHASLVRPLVSPLHVSETGASVIALRITLFPNRGFSIGITTHHAVLDGKSTTMFMKSWAYLTKQNPPLLPELTPFYDRNVIKDPPGFDMIKFLRSSPGSTLSDCRNNPKLFEFRQFSILDELTDLYRATFELSRSDIDKLRQRVSSNWDSSSKPKLHLSTFVVTFAYVFDCILKVTEGDESKMKVMFGFSADYRNRLIPPVPENYFGNCVGFKMNYENMREQLVGRDGDSFSAVAEKISGLVKEMGNHDQNDILKEGELLVSKRGLIASEKYSGVGVAGSPRFGVYSIDFGWGHPKKVSFISIENGSISMADSENGDGGVEVGLYLKKQQMDVFTSVFLTGLSL
ncbi:phenolic glucoside malonyltransferase 1-like [Cannabis sativa]|uniref:phenolic glucoside malonyltransferase 1-like n=1 Tax=Cannabis sativa TaxID=3483 RepID=UPI0029C9CCBB|nr:phenolic glucoside malonyltransferase 1-like [Cannabis sativa]